MKRLIVLGMVLSLLLMLWGCGLPKKENSAGITAPSTRPTVPLNPYKTGDFDHDGKFMFCTAGESHPGIDVSAYQGRIDWQQVKDYGIEFVFVRLGYRGYDTGMLREDEYARQNLTGAREAGLLVGAYFFSQALNIQEAAEEAEFALEILDGFTLDLPLVYDWERMEEEDARTDQTTKKELMQCVKTFCAKVEQAGCRAMIYFNRSLSETHLDLVELTQYPFWLAAYTGNLTFPYRMEFWQYHDQGSVPGIEGPVDMDIWLPIPQPA